MKTQHLRHALAASLLAVPLLANAQAPTTLPSPAAPAAGAPVAPPAPPVTPEMRGAITALLDAMNTRDGLTKAYQQIAQGLAPRMGDAMNRQIEANTALSADQKQRIRQNIGPSFENAVKDSQTIVTNPKLVDETIDKMIPIYAGHFTLQEVKELTAFYRTPIGSKSLTALPQANAEAIQAGAQLFGPRVAALMDKVMKQQTDAATAAAPAPAPGKAPAKK